MRAVPALVAASALLLGGCGTATPTTDLVASWPVDETGVVLRVDVHAGFARSGIVSFEADGRVVRAADTSVHASVDDYATWRISRAGLERVLRAFDDLDVRTAEAGDSGPGAVSPSSRNVGLWFGGGRVLSGSAPLAATGDPAEPVERLWALANDVADPAWHGRYVVGEPGPWVPDGVGVLAGPPDTIGAAGDGFRPWPLGRGIRALSLGSRPSSHGVPEEALCLTGDDAAKVFALMDGENLSRLRVHDGEQWELTLMVHLPAYHLLSSPCA